MFCTKCGKELKDGSKFCTECGAALDGAPAPAPAPAPAQTPVYAAAPVYTPAPAAASKKKMSGGVIALIITAAVLAVAAIALVAFVLLSGKGDADPEASGTPAFSNVGGDHAIDAPDAPSVGGFDAEDMDGDYYCAQETGSTLELDVSDGQLSIYKTRYGNLDVSTLIPVPSSNRFTINYGGRLIEFFYSPSGESVTVSEAGESTLFTEDGDHAWVIDAAPQVTDPFTDPNGYILPTDTQYITEADLYPFSEEEVKLIRNEIYARHGYSFTMEKFRDYFNAKNWYFENPNVNVNTFGTQDMNQYERANIDTIKAYEEMMGW